MGALSKKGSKEGRKKTGKGEKGKRRAERRWQWGRTEVMGWSGAALATSEVPVRVGVKAGLLCVHPSCPLSHCWFFL